ncbi:Hypothetical protein NTJ_10464 [Nesidiocoris tenuis]|uniref:Uncharacterized protein n=1 Tax=Nesidiocoris tenuis TaxID=355587 RepID=A0ABN7B246_9HEMI|nr:Hypothetical protein NTJ_10464 [Nesidiocoris tenuis]
MAQLLSDSNNLRVTTGGAANTFGRIAAAPEAAAAVLSPAAASSAVPRGCPAPPDKSGRGWWSLRWDFFAYHVRPVKQAPTDHTYFVLANRF